MTSPLQQRLAAARGSKAQEKIRAARAAKTSTPTPAPAVPYTGVTDGGTSWGLKRLQANCDDVRAVPVGSGRNSALNLAAFKIGQAVGAGEIDEQTAYDALCDADGGEHGHPATRPTVLSGLASGMKQPRGPKDRRPDTDADAWIATLGDVDQGDDVEGDVFDDVEPVTLDEAHDVFKRWLGDGYDLAVLDVVLAVAAGDQLSGDPAWLLVVGGSGAAKTETVAPLAASGAHVTSSISSEGALLSGTSKKETAAGATGGLLRAIGASGILVVKDVTTILSMGREVRASVLAALREIYDGKWERNVGTDGGRTLTWEGRLVVIGAVTTAWDSHHAVVAAMGDRFILVRIDSTEDRVGAGMQALENTGSEVAMRADLGAAMRGVLGGIETADVVPTREEKLALLALADLVTLARTGVETDMRGVPVNSHAPEMPTRFAKQLLQVLRGGVALGMDRDYALRLAARCAHDSMPPLRLAVLLSVADMADQSTTQVSLDIGKPRTTTDNVLQSLELLGVLSRSEPQHEGAGWRYSVNSDRVDAGAVRRLRQARSVALRAVEDAA